MNGTDTVGGEFTLVAGVNASIPLSYNASALEVAEAVNGMASWVGLVLADRRELSERSDNEGDMFEWRLTFSPAQGDVPELRVRELPTSDASILPPNCCNPIVVLNE